MHASSLYHSLDSQARPPSKRLKRNFDDDDRLRAVNERILDYNNENDNDNDNDNDPTTKTTTTTITTMTTGITEH